VTGLAAWLDEVQAQGIKLGLDRIRSALALAGHPQRTFPSLLVGGTNGKGSTVSFATALLGAAGHRVGSTISPHLVAYRERIRLDGAPVAQDVLEEVAADVRAGVHGQPDMEHLTFFELGALLAFATFRQQRVDAAVIEVGMGGEFDATRAGESRVAAIVSVDLDHQKYLGDSIEEIARTKARVAPPDGELVTTEVRPDRLAILREEAEAVGSTVRVAGEDFEWHFRDGRFSYRGEVLLLDDIELGMKGAHQGQNAACALASVEALCRRESLAAPDPWEAGRALAGCKLAGRMERVRVAGGPAFLLDGAHNPAGAEALAEALAARRRPRERVWLLASMVDKERAPILEALAPHVDRVICTVGESSPRFEAPELLVAQVEALGLPATIAPTAAEAAVALNRRLAARDEVLVAGSLYLVGDVRAALGLPVA